ncbi:M48 family metallopeptidase [Serratia entomophila]|uniref:M48 family metallopeptidase n=1 Tax=Serratia entomophila TaxID=42906 RepID=UPI002179275F|nr:M48 family metallopeptidase [Serratia entomophila]CAI0913083.1 Putative Zn-dependent protease [Serratia entomophila]CAI0916472.1 Putative Zn-dependent protease [Serratia entomophila]CAI0921895.1 Putative Zn-dependent protease [Serratia entomophila]CAI0976590.1 Putative Zn-dependent protease [Serratia entomophila]CAI1603861.1 Putative Zn-dependent protease [Serratia entomophila]
MILEGFYQPAGRAARETARLLLNESGEGVTLQRQSGQHYVPLAQISVSAPLGSIPLTLTFSDGGRFVPGDDAAFRQWFYRRRSPGWVHRLERHKRGVALALLMTLLAIPAYVYVLLPWASSEIAVRIPTTAEQKLGEHTLLLLRQSGFKPSALPAERQRAVRQLFERVMPADMRRERTPLTLQLMAAPGAPNAFMLPDGTLVLSDSLVALAADDDGLAAVMLHEMGHHAYRHPMRMLVRSSLVALTMMWMTGDVSGIGDTLLQSASFVHEMQFSRSMERDADAWAMAEMRRQGRSLAAMAQLYRALSQAPERNAEGSLALPAWLSTHPAMQERLDAVRAAMAEQGSP